MAQMSREDELVHPREPLRRASTGSAEVAQLPILRYVARSRGTAEFRWE